MPRLTGVVGVGDFLVGNQAKGTFLAVCVVRSLGPEVSISSCLTAIAVRSSCRRGQWWHSWDCTWVLRVAPHMETCVVFVRSKPLMTNGQKFKKKGRNLAKDDRKYVYHGSSHPHLTHAAIVS